MEYFEDEIWELTWVATYEPSVIAHRSLDSEPLIYRARAAVVDVFEEDYASIDIPKPANTPHDHENWTRPSSSPYKFGEKRKARFHRSKDVTLNVIETYLRAPTFQCDDPILFWRTELAAGRQPQLSQMALDYLTAPCTCYSPFLNCHYLNLNIIGTSVDVERAFSRGRRAISLYRHSLSEETARASIIFGSWVAANIVPKEQLIKATRELSSRKPQPPASATQLGKRRCPEPQSSDTETSQTTRRPSSQNARTSTSAAQTGDRRRGEPQFSDAETPQAAHKLSSQDARASTSATQARKRPRIEPQSSDNETQPPKRFRAATPKTASESDSEFGKQSKDDSDNEFEDRGVSVPASELASTVADEFELGFRRLERETLECVEELDDMQQKFGSGSARSETEQEGDVFEMDWLLPETEEGLLQIEEDLLQTEEAASVSDDDELEDEDESELEEEYDEQGWEQEMTWQERRSAGASSNGSYDLIHSE